MTYQIIDVRPEWHEQYDNPASFNVLLDKLPPMSDYRYVETGGQYFATIGDTVSMYAYTRPGGGYGGRVFRVTMQDGSGRDLKGPWSSSASACNTHHPEAICVDCSITDSPAVLEKGYTFSAGSVLLLPLVQWFISNRQRVDWSLYLMGDGTVQPTRGRFVKPCGGSTRYIARLFSYPGKDHIAQYAQEHQAYFMDKATTFWRAQQPIYDEASGEQRRVINA